MKDKSVTLKKRVQKVHSKAEFVGMLYLIATIALAAFACAPLLYGTSVGNMSVVNFWRPFLDFKNIKGSAIPVAVNVLVAGIYALLLLTVVINVIRSLACLGRLFKKKASRINGFNRNMMAMDDMGKIFSGTYCVIIVFGFMIHLIAGAGFTNLFYIALAVGFIFHFWCGLVGGNVSRFTVGENVAEEKRTLGRLAPFFRNLAQFVFVGLIMYFLSNTNLMLNALKWLENNAFSDLFKGAKMDLFLYGVAPLLQLLICIWTLVLVKHATATTEFDRDGTEAAGMKNFRIFSIFILVTAGALFGLMYFASTKRDGIVPTMGTLYLAVVALAAVVEEFCMCRLPNAKGKIAEAPAEATAEGEADAEIDFDRQTIDPLAASAETGSEAAEAAAPEAPANVPAMYHIPLQCITQPAVFMQPNGQPVMVMPMIAGPQMMAPMQPQTPPAPEAREGTQPVYGYSYASPYGNSYANPYGYGYTPPSYWANGRPYRPFDPYQYVQEPVAEESAENEMRTEDEATETPAGQQEEAAASAAPAAPAVPETEEERRRRLKERKANIAADKKSLRAEAAIARKESKAAAERAAVERALAEKWMRKAKQPITEDSAVASSAAMQEAPAPTVRDTAPETPAAAQTPETSVVETSVAETPVVEHSEPAAVTAYTPAAETLPKQAMMETYAYEYPRKECKEPAYPEAADLSEEDLSKPLPPKKWTVTCPDCATKLTVKEGAFAYRCPECGGVFQLRKVFKAKRNETAEETETK